MHEQCERHPKKAHKKERKWCPSDALSGTDRLCSSEHGLRGIGVAGSPLSVLHVSWAASKFKATSYWLEASVEASPYRCIWYHCTTTSGLIYTAHVPMNDTFAANGGPIYIQVFEVSEVLSVLSSGKFVPGWMWISSLLSGWGVSPQAPKQRKRISSIFFHFSFDKMFSKSGNQSKSKIDRES